MVSAQIERAARLLRAGHLVAFPTETVYGLGADAANPAAVAAIFRAKGRPANHPVIVHLPPGSDPHEWTARASPATRKAIDALVERFWPGPLTLVVRRAAHVSDAVTGGQDSVGLRCPAHPFAQALLTRFSQLAAEEASARRGHPAGIAAPSANRFGRISPTSARHVRDEFPEIGLPETVPGLDRERDAGESIYVLDGGDCPVGIESTIVDLSRFDTAGPVLLRPGSVTVEMLTEILGAPRMPGSTSLAAGPRASGTLAAHYAPRTALKLVDAAALQRAVENGARGAAVWARSVEAPAGHPLWLLAPADAGSYARELYATLRRLDAARADEIWIEAPPSGPEWVGVNDRLKRAAFGSEVAARKPSPSKA